MRTWCCGTKEQAMKATRRRSASGMSCMPPPLNAHMQSSCRTALSTEAALNALQTANSVHLRDSRVISGAADTMARRPGGESITRTLRQSQSMRLLSSEGTAARCMLGLPQGMQGDKAVNARATAERTASQTSSSAPLPSHRAITRKPSCSCLCMMQPSFA
jgi:hypothetical protein